MPTNTLHAEPAFCRAHTVALLVLPLVAATAALLLRSNYLSAIFLFYGLPATYLIAQRPSLLNRPLLISATLISIPFALIVDYIGVVSGLWFVPHSVLSVRFLGIVPLEDLLWLAASATTVLIFYHSFTEAPLPHRTSPRLYRYAAVSLIVVAVFIVSAWFLPSLYVHHSPYTYTVVASLFFLVPALLLVLRYPGTPRNAAPVALYFLYLTVAFELTATHLGYWTFPGSYLLPPLRIAGFAPVPLEEFMFVGVVGPLAVLGIFRWLYPAGAPRHDVG